MIIKQADYMPFYHQLAWQMCLHEIQTEKTLEMWFKVDGRILRFGLLEFACVTGLNCEDNGFDLSPPDKVSVKSFLGVSPCSVDQLEAIFLKEPKESKKKIIMAKLLNLEMVLFPRRTNRYRNVKEEHVSLACDLEKFEGHPWGRLVYEETIDSLMKVARANRAVRTSDRPGFSLSGYTLGFQVCSFQSNSTYRVSTVNTEMIY